MKTLFISSNAPWPATGGDRQRTDLLYRSLQLLGEVDYLLCRPQSMMPDGLLEKLRDEYRLVDHMDVPPRGALGAGGLLRPLHPQLIDRLATTFGSADRTFQPVSSIATRVEHLLTHTHYDLVVCRYLHAASVSAPWRFATTIVDVDDYLPQVYAQRISHSQKPLERAAYRYRLHGLNQVLPKLLSNAAHLWIPNPLDRAAIAHSSVSILPNIPYKPDDKPAPPCPPNTGNVNIGMIGSLNYGVNIDGLEYFLGEVWPIIRQTRDDAVLKIIGNGLTDALRERWSAHAGVEVVGFVDNLREAYDDCAFCVVPIREGGGTKIKVVEALSYGRTVVLTTESLRGFEHVLEDEEALLVRDDATSFADACLKLINNPGYRDQLAAAGHTLVSQHFSFDGFSDVVANDVHQVLENSPSANNPLENSADEH